MKQAMVIPFICSLLFAGTAPVEMEWLDHTLNVTTNEQAHVTDILKIALSTLQYDDSYAVGEIISQRPEIENKIMKSIREKTMIKQHYLTDGSTEYLHVLPLTGEIMALLMPLQQPVQYVVPMLCPCCGQQWPDAKSVPDDITLVPKQTETSDFTGVVIDCRGKLLNPCLFPRIMTEQGKLVYSIDFALHHKVIDNGLVQYVTNEGSLVSRAGRNPLMLNAKEVTGSRSTIIIISDQDAIRVHGSKGIVQLLKECRVVILFGP